MTDNLLSNIPFDSLVVGEKKGPYTFRVSRELADNLIGAVGVAGEASACPPAVYPTLFLMALRQSMGGIPAGSILAKQELEFHKPLAVDVDVHVFTWIGETYLRRERPFVVIEFEIQDDVGETVLTGRKIIVWPTGPGEV